MYLWMIKILSPVVIIGLINVFYLFDNNETRLADKYYNFFDELINNSSTLVNSQRTRSHENNNRDEILEEWKASGRSVFDFIKHKFYEKAISASLSQTAAPRYKLNLTEWNNRPSSWGGLLTEDRKLLSELYYNATSIFEYGIGESTYIAAHTNVQRYTGVDSDCIWVSTARDNVLSNIGKKKGKSRHDGNNFRFSFADIGFTKVWGKPLNQNLAKIAYNYQIAPLVPELKAFDVYMIDGRYRVSCACISFLHALKYMDIDDVKDKVRVAIHDATGRENTFGKYGQLQMIADVVDKAEELWVYRLKDGITKKDIYQLWKTNTKIQFRQRGRRLNELIVDSGSSFDDILNKTYTDAISTSDLLRTNKNSLIPKLFDMIKTDPKENYLTRDDVNMLAQLYTNTRSVFEFGMSDLSKLASYMNIPRYAGSDSKPKSITDFRNFTVLNEQDHFRFAFSDIGKTNEKGMTLDSQISKLFYDYSILPLAIENEAFEVYLIDRCRYAFVTACASFLHAMKYNSDMKKVAIVVHNASTCTDDLSNLLELAQVRSQSDNLQIYHLLQNIKQEDILTKVAVLNYL